jgi:hypothetical protein
MIPRQDPHNRTSKSAFEEMGTSSRHKRDADTPAPPRRIDIKRKQLAAIRHIQIPRWRCSRKSLDRPSFDSHNRMRLQRIEIREIVPLGPIFRAKLIEIFVRKKCPIGRLP